MGDLSKNFSGYEMQCSFGCCASWGSPKLVEKLQHDRDIGKSMTITSGVRCESFNKSINGSLVSSHIPDLDRVGFAVHIAAQWSIDGYVTVIVAQKLFKQIRIVGEHSGNFIHLDVDKTKPQEVLWTY